MPSAFLYVTYLTAHDISELTGTGKPQLEPQAINFHFLGVHCRLQTQRLSWVVCVQGFRFNNNWMARRIGRLTNRIQKDESDPLWESACDCVLMSLVQILIVGSHVSSLNMLTLPKSPALHVFKWVTSPSSWLYAVIRPQPLSIHDTTTRQKPADRIVPSLTSESFGVLT